MKKLVEYCLKSAKSALILIFLPLVGVAFVAYFTTQVSATSNTINFQGKIVRNDVGNEGLNVSAGSPACVFLGPSNDTCDFRIKYYSADTLGTLLATEVFSNVEIGEYNGIFNLALGTGSFTGGSETSFRNMFLNNSAVYVEMDFAPNGTTYTETFLNPDGKRMAVRAAAYAISAQGSSQQFQFDIANDASGYSNISAGQVFYDGSNNVLRLYDGANWLAIQASIGNLPSYWLLNEAATPDIIYSYTGLDVAFGGSDASSPFFYDVSGELLTLTNTTSGLSFRVNDQAGDTTPFAIDASGNVGIGTDSPSAKLEVTGGRTILESLGESQTLGIGRTDGAGLYWLGVNASSTPALSFLNNSGVERFRISDNGGLVQIGANDTSIALSLRKATVDATHIEWNFSNVANNKDMTISGYNGTTAYTFMSFDWDNQVSNFETGRVGIGVINPNGFLGIRAATASRSQINFVSSAGIDPSVPTNGDMWWNGTNLYFFDGSSSVDLLAGGGGGGSLFTDGGATTYLTSITDNLAIGGTGSTSPFFFSVSEQLLTLTNTTSGLSFRVNDEAGDTTPFVIDADGNVGIGTTTPGGRLEVAGVSSVISNTAGDITFDSASGNISFAGDSLINVMNGTFAGNVVLSGGQLQLGNHVTNPTAVGEGAVVYNSTDKILYYNNGTTWAEVGKVYTGTTGQMLRHDGTDWVASSALTNDGTNISVSGQLRVGNYGSKPSGIGEGSLVYDTTIGSLFVYDGTDWKAISTAETFSSTGVVTPGDYLQLTHNLNSNDILMNAWVKEGSTWKPATNLSNTIYNSQSNEWHKGDSAGKLRTTVRDTNIELSESINIGTGNDGSITVSSSTSINTTNIIAGRSCVDGGDAVNYSVTALTATTATLESSPSVGCLNVGDEVLIINLRGTNTAVGNVGNYETLRIQSVASSTVTFTTSKIKFYGDNVGGDTNIGLGTGNQTVMLQRVPNYLNVTVNAAVNFLPDTWLSPTGAVNNGAGEGGVMFFRASGAVAVSGSITATGRGYIGGVTTPTGDRGGAGGEAFCGPGGAGGSTSGSAGSSGAAGGAAGRYTGGGGNGYCGGGGGAGGLGSDGTPEPSSGGSGGGGQGYFGSGGGGGYGTAGTRGGGGSLGTDGGTNISGDGGGGGSGSNAGGGGGGSYGDSTLTKLLFGSSGGAGGSEGNSTGGQGGNGGGIIFISSNSLTVSGSVANSGNVGGNRSGTYGGGGGGGAGGSIRIDGNAITLGSSLVTATGGAGGTAHSGGPGGVGGAGRIAVYYSTSVSGASTPASSNAVLPYYPYGVYTSDAIPTPNSVDYGDIKWSNSKNTFGNVSVQTRTSGNTHLSFDGLDDAVTIASTHGLTNISASIEAWVNVPSNMEQGSIVQVGSYGTNGYGFGVGGSTYDNRGNNLIMIFAGVRWIDTNVDIGTGWHHIAMVISDTGVPTAYIDGVSLGAFAGTNANSPTVGTYIGGVSANKFKGMIGDVRIWNVARNLSNIQVNMNTELVGTETNLVGYWKLTDGVGTTVDDLTSNSNDGTIFNGAKWVKTGSWLWEGWKPSTATTNYLDVENADTHTNWVGTNATIADGDVRRLARTFEDENETNLTNVTKITSSTNGGYAETTVSAINLSEYDYLTFWVRSSQVGNVLRIGMGESAATELTDDITIDTTAVWQKVYWDLSDIQGISRDAITKVRLTNLIASSNTIYIDNVRAEKVANSSSGSQVQSTPNHVIQYRVIFSTTNTSYRPLLENIQITWSTGYRIEATSENISRIYNYTSGDKELKLTVSASAGSSYSSSWTETGGNVYRASGFVGIGDSTPDVELKVVGALCVKANADDCAGATAGTIYANNTSVQSADLAEMYKVSDLTIEAGDIVSLDPNAIAEVQKSNLDNIENVMGVVSTAPGLLMNDSRDDNSRPIGLIGKLPVKVMTTGRSITKGDVITASTLPGIGVMRDDPGMVVAKALEETYDWNEDTCTSVDNISEIVWPIDEGRNESKPCFKVMVDSFESEIRDSMMIKYNLTLMDSVYIGKIMAFVDVVWFQPQWISDDMAKIISDYNNGILGGNGGGWTYDDGALKTDKEVSVGSISGNTLSFNILSGGVLNIGNGNLVADSGGNLSLAGDLILGGRLKSNNGSILLEIGAGETDLFAIHNNQGEVVFSVDGKGKVGGKGVYRSEWVRVESNSRVRVSHNFGVTPSNINIIKADNVQGYGFTSKGLGTEFYYEYYDSNAIEVYNTTNNVIYVKLTLEK